VHDGVGVDRRERPAREQLAAEVIRHGQRIAMPALPSSK
jgi:hypothetical protein